MATKKNNKKAPKKANKTTAKSVKKPAKKTVRKVTKVDAVDSTDKPLLEDILDKADRAFTDVVKNYLLLGEAYVEALTYYGKAGKKAFRDRFPLTDNALRNLEYVGRGKLLPQFAMCSDRFVKGLLDMVDSLKWQYKLLGASKLGMIRVRINGNIVDARFEDLKSEKLVDGVLSIISDADKDLTPEEICEKLRNLRREVRSNFEREKRPLFAIGTHDGQKVVRFFKSKPLTADDLRKVLSKLES